MDTCLNNMAPFGRIASCGSISNYGLKEPVPLYNYMNIIIKGLSYCGFNAMHSKDVWPEIQEMILGWINDGTFLNREVVYEGGLELVRELMNRCSTGENEGKQAIKLY